MAFSRRSFLRVTLGIALLASSGYILKDLFLPSQIDPAKRRTLEALLDTLIPSDTTPGAVQLGVSRKILGKAFEDSEYRRLVRKGCDWLDRMAGDHKVNSFSSLGGREREELVGQAEEAPAGSLPRIFFERMRAEAFFHYYAHPASWKKIGYTGPPQPDGYPDYAAAPKASS
ncbi:MAG: gluconate 2-dehydrogenase subunit 3 family protein [Acidobacteriota bacterium]